MNSVCNSWHPFITFFYYINVVVLSTCFDHPVLIGGMVIGGLLWLSSLVEQNVFWRSFLFYIGMFLTITVTNPLFSHRGATILFFLNGNAVTKETVQYGAAMGGKMVAVLAYSRCFAEIFKVNQFLYLCQKISPKLGLLLSMALAFLPRFRRQAQQISECQKTLGMYSKGSYTDRIFSEIRVFDSLITWSLESGVTTADSMCARGYGQTKRSNFTIYRFTKQDGKLLAAMAVVFGYLYAGILYGVWNYSYYPKLTEVSWEIETVSCYLGLLVIAMLPVILERKEKMKWKRLESRI